MKKLYILITSISLLFTLSACKNDEGNIIVDKEQLSEAFFGEKNTEEWQEHYSGTINIDEDNNGVLDWKETEMTISYASDFYNDDDELNTLYRNAVKWAEQYPNITITRDERFKKAVTGNDNSLFFEILLASSQDSTMPDIFYAPLSAEAYDQDLTLDLTPYFRSDNEARLITNNAFEFITSVDGQEIWGVPYMSVSQFPAVNVGLLRENNINIPSYDWTYEEYENLRSDVATLTTSGSCIFPGIIDFSNHGPNYFDAVPNGWNGFNIETQRFDFESATKFGSWLSEVAFEGDQGLHYSDLSLEEQEAICGSYSYAWGDGFQAVDNIWMYFLSTNVTSLIKTRGLEIDIYPMPESPEGGETSLHGYYDAYGLSYELSNDLVKAEAVFDLAKWLSYGQEGTEARWDLIDEDISEYGNTIEDWIALGNLEADFPFIHPSTHLMDYIMGWPATTNPLVLENHPLVKGFPIDGPYAIFNFEAFKNVEFQEQLSNAVAFPRQIPAASSAIEEINIWLDLKERIRNEGYSYESLAPEIDDLMNQILDDYLRYYSD